MGVIYVFFGGGCHAHYCLSNEVLLQMDVSVSIFAMCFNFLLKFDIMALAITSSVLKMNKDDIALDLHHMGKFMKDRKLKYAGNDCMSLWAADIDKLTFFELKDCVKDVRCYGLVEFWMWILR